MEEMEDESDMETAVNDADQLALDKEWLSAFIRDKLQKKI